VPPKLEIKDLILTFNLPGHLYLPSLLPPIVTPSEFNMRQNSGMGIQLRYLVEEHQALLTSQPSLCLNLLRIR